MVPATFEQRYIPKVIAVLSAYEAVAITSNKRLPTLSAGVWQLYQTTWGKPILWLVWGWLTSHWFCVHIREEEMPDTEVDTEL